MKVRIIAGEVDVGLEEVMCVTYCDGFRASVYLEW